MAWSYREGPYREIVGYADRTGDGKIDVNGTGRCQSATSHWLIDDEQFQVGHELVLNFILYLSTAACPSLKSRTLHYFCCIMIVSESNGLFHTISGHTVRTDQQTHSPAAVQVCVPECDPRHRRGAILSVAPAYGLRPDFQGSSGAHLNLHSVLCTVPHSTCMRTLFDFVGACMRAHRIVWRVWLCGTTAPLNPPCSAGDGRGGTAWRGLAVSGADGGWEPSDWCAATACAARSVQMSTCVV
jgi:hypothetical protein